MQENAPKGYFSKAFRTEAFRREPVPFITRSLTWLALVAARKNVKITVPPFDFKMEIPARLRHTGSTGIYLQRQYYEPFFYHLSSFLEKGGTFIDCGANQGIYTCAAARVTGESGTVIAIEPQAFATACIRRNASLSGLKNVHVVHAAISDREGTAQLDISNGPVMATIVHELGNRVTETVRTVSLDRIANDHALTRMDWVKLDVEGAEYLAISGATEVVRLFRPSFIVETDDPYTETFQKMHRRLREQDYQSFELDWDGHLRPVPETRLPRPHVIYRPASGSPPKRQRSS